MATLENHSALRRGARIAVLYLAAGGAWIFLSDALLARWVGDTGDLLLWQTIKGLGFVSISAALIFHLASRAALPAQHERLPGFRWPFAIFSLLALLITLTGAYTYVRLSEAIRHEAEDKLSAIAKLKNDQLHSWLDERRGDARVMGHESRLAQHLARVTGGGRLSAADENTIRAQLQRYIDAYGYSAISVFDARGQLLLGHGQQICSQAVHAESAVAVQRSGQVALVDLHHECDAREPLKFGLMAPVTYQGHVVAALYLESDPTQFLFPLIRQWPGNMTSAETLLVRREGDRVRFLSPLRHSADPPLSKTLALDDPALLAAIALGGRLGIIRQAHDYRGEVVLAHASAVQGTPWVLISKMDDSVAFASLRQAAVITSGISALLLALSGFMLWHWWRRQTDTVLHRLELQERERQALTTHYDYLSQYANDIILLADHTGRHVEVNARAVEAYGYSRDELLAMRVTDLNPPTLRDDCARQIEALDSHGALRYETVHQRKDGSTFAVEVSARPINTTAQPYYSLIIRDISERKAAEARIQRMQNLYAALSQCNQAIVRIQEESELYPEICRVAVHHGGMKMAWLGLADPASRRVTPVAWAGEGTEYLQDIQISTDPDSPLGRGPTGTAIREGRAYWCQDFQNDPATAPWHARGAQFGWQASAAVPIFRGGRPVGALTLYAGEVGAFDAPARALLEEMAIDIGYALDRFDSDRARAALQNEILQTKTRLESILSSISQGIWSADAATYRILYLSPAVEAIYGRPATAFEDDPQLWLKAVHPEDAAIAATMNRQLEAEGQAVAEYRILRPDGTIRWILNEARLIRDASGHPLRVDGVISDITERRAADEQLRLSAKVFEQSAEGIIICNADNRIISVNRAFCEITGVPAAEALGQDPGFLRSGRHDRDFYRAMWKDIQENGHWQGEIWNRRSNGDVFPAWLSISVVRDADGKIAHYIGIFSDISRHKQAEEHIRYLAHFDALTGLPNRTLLNDRIAHAINLAQRARHSMALMFLDLDRFKNINDSLGHQVGDQILVEVASRLKAAMREEDTVSRLGGDEFILLLPNADTDGAAHVAEKIIQTITAPFLIDGHELSMTPSIGIAMYPVDGQDAASLIQCADVAMYRAKQNGRNTFRFFTPEMHLHASRTLQLENALRHALERQQLLLHYQPQLDLASGRMIGCEALLRWHHPEFGMISPSDFVPIAEDSGQILPIGAWVMRTAVQQIAAWHRAGLPLIPVAVNLSAAQFRQPNLPELAASILQEADLPPQYLEIELTESITMEEPEVAISMLERLHQCGVRLSIDDFGTGYSSLSYLKRLKLHKLKVDQSFVHDITRDPDDEAIVSAIIGLAAHLNLRTIAEGVETRQQLEFLRERGCHEIQGYYYSKPLPPHEFAALLRAETANQR